MNDVARESSHRGVHQLSCLILWIARPAVTGDEPMQHVPVEEPEGDVVQSRTSEVDLRHHIDAARQTSTDSTGA